MERPVRDEAKPLPGGVMDGDLEVRIFQVQGGQEVALSDREEY